MPTRAKRTPSHNKKKKAFVELLRNGSTVLDAVKVIGLSRRHIYTLKEQDPVFAAEWDEAYGEAQEAIKNRLEAEVDRRATGYIRELTFKGLLTGDKVIEHSDNLLMFRLKKLDPTYRDNPAKVDVTVQADKLAELTAALQAPAEEPEQPKDEQPVPEKGSTDE